MMKLYLENAQGREYITDVFSVNEAEGIISDILRKKKLNKLKPRKFTNRENDVYFEFGFTDAVFVIVEDWGTGYGKW